MTLLAVDALEMRFGERLIQTGVSFKVEKGTIFAIMGGSGCGKSTLLDALAGWLPAASGQLTVARGIRIGYASQRPYLFHGSIADNLRLADPQASDARLHTAAEAAQVLRFAQHLPLGLDTVIGERGFGLSGGEARRIALARVFLREPRIVILDEPTSALDPELTGEVLRTMRELAQEHMTMLVVTHEMGFARDVANRVIFMDKGEIVEEAPAKEFFSAPKQERTKAFLCNTL